MMMEISEPEHVDHINKSRRNRRGRVYIPHGRGEEKPYRPHTQHIEVEYTECGPDVNSKRRWLPSPDSGDRPEEHMFYPPLKSLRSFPDKKNVTCKTEYDFYPPHGIPIVYSKGKVTIFDGIHKGSEKTTSEITDVIQFGRRGLVHDSRDGYPSKAPGDKPYKTPQYSENFHKLGSTRPVVNFGGSKPEVADTFIPLQSPPAVPAIPYKILEAERLKRAEIEEVRNLKNWRPASPLTAPTTEWR